MLSFLGIEPMVDLGLATLALKFYGENAEDLFLNFPQAKKYFIKAENSIDKKKQLHLKIHFVV